MTSPIPTVMNIYFSYERLITWPQGRLQREIMALKSIFIDEPKQDKDNFSVRHIDQVFCFFYEYLPLAHLNFLSVSYLRFSVSPDSTENILQFTLSIQATANRTS